MDSNSVSIDIDDYGIREERKAGLKYRVHPQLCAAMKEGNVDKFMEALEKHSAQERVSLSDIINIQGPSGNSLLHVAAGIEEAGILQDLLEVNCDKWLAAKANYLGDTALHVAARAGRIRSAELLLGCGNIVDIANDAGNTALHEAVKNRHHELTPLLLSRGSRLVYQKNKESKCPLYLAVEMGDVKNLMLLMEAVDGHEVLRSRIEGMSPVHGAVIHKRIEMLEVISRRKKELFYLKDAGGGTPLHLAASVNYVDGVEFLINNFSSSAFEGNKEGYLPIHIACKMGHIKIMKKLLQLWPNPEELLNLMDGQNILHVAAKYGQHFVVCSILYDPKLEKLVNAKDKEGNTPLHVAAFQLQSLALLFLVSQDVVDLELVNNDNMTAFDIADEQLKKIYAPRKDRQLSAIHVLEAVKAPTSKEKAICEPKDLDLGRDEERPYMKKLREVANHRMVVVTLVATMTFAAGFSVPGGYNSSDPNAGIAMLLNKPMYDVFVISNTIAMYSSIMTAVFLLLAQIAVDPHSVHNAIIKARLPQLIALVTMSMAFMAGVYVTTSKLTWIAVVTLIIGIAALFHTFGAHCYFLSWPLFYFVILILPLKRRWFSRRRWLSRNARRS